jgi:Fe-Mn family superoxide dismutase
MSNFQAQIKHKNTDFTPFLSAETMDYHYGKHHCGYANKLNSLIENTEFANMTLEEIVNKTYYCDCGTNQVIYNNAAQLFNHDFYWQCLQTPSIRPKGILKKLVEYQFGAFDEFLNQYIAYADKLFGSGWCWITLDSNALHFVNTSNAEAVIAPQRKSICVIDLWEHAYYLDYRNDRASYVRNIIRECINWEFCESLIEIA